MDEPPKNRSQKLLEGLFDLINDESSLHFGDFVEVSETFLKGYTKFLKVGMPAKTVGIAMLGATVNMFTMLGMQAELPNLLRGIADRIEGDGTYH